MFGILLALLACSTEESDEKNISPGEPILAEWHGGIQPIVANQCATCHTENGSAPFDLTTYDKVAPLADIVLDSVVNKRMPPWLPDASCSEFQDQRLLTDREITALKSGSMRECPSEMNVFRLPPSQKLKRSPPPTSDKLQRDLFQRQMAQMNTAVFC